MSILKPIIYFSIFNHPLTLEETLLFSNITNKEKATDELLKLIKAGIINKIGNYFLIGNHPLHIKKREKGNFEAEKVMPKAKNAATLISKFPYIKGVAISGSLSKGYFDDNSDFDFFVITKSKRVWISRIFLALYKRLFLNNSYKEFCVNYYVSSSTLEIEEKNRFTATEIATVIPIYGAQEFTDFYTVNEWVKEYFPNLDFKNKLKNLKEIKKPLATRAIEFTFNNYLGTLINYVLMKHISKRWKHRYKNKTNSPYKSKKEISKHHPDNFQQQVLSKINKKYNLLEKKHGIKIAKEIA